ncbi:O-antigen ligase family protein [Patescibacteria group bacterium]|nr:O-antigen ligase family protein [Patescibacteria group bacterium]
MKPKLSDVVYLNLVLLVIFLPFSKVYLFSRGAFTPYTDIILYGADILIFSLILQTIIYEIHQKTRQNGSKIALFLLISGAISLILSTFPRETYNYYWILRLFEYLCLFLTISYLFREVKFKKAIFWGFLASGLLQTIIAAGQFITQHSLGLKILGEPIIAANINGIAKIDLINQKIIRAYGTFSHPNQLAAFLVVACATAWLIYATETNTLKRNVAAILMVLFIGGEFLSFSRAGIAALIIFFAFVLISIRIKHGWGAIKKQIEIIFLSFLVFSLILFPFLIARVSPAPTEFTRTFYNLNGVEVFNQNPITGVGIGNLLPAMAQKIEAKQAWQIQPPHNYFLEVACETGIIGLLLYIYLFISRIVGLFKSEPLAQNRGDLITLALIGIIFAFIFLMQFDHYFYTLPQTILLLWLVLGMINGQIKKPHNLGL